MKALIPLSVNERIKADVAEKASPEYKKNRALRHFPPKNPPEQAVFDATSFGQRVLELGMLEGTAYVPDEEQEELDGVLDLRQ